MAVLGCQSLGLIDVGGIGSIEGDPQKYESPVNHLGLLGALQAAGGGDPTLDGLFRKLDNVPTVYGRTPNKFDGKKGRSGIPGPTD
ncbi:hypothetical protein D3C85_1681600 [compost metagenome]